MTRLDELRQQKKEIDAEIKQLLQKEIVTERCKFHKEHYGARTDEWIVTYKSRSAVSTHEEKNKRLIANPNRKKAIQEIGEVIKDLQEFKKLLEKTDFGDEE